MYLCIYSFIAMVFYYAVASGRVTGVFLTWDECKESVINYKNAIYKKFATKEAAEEFIQLHSQNENVAPVCTAPQTRSIPGESASTNADGTPFVPDYYVYTDGACSKNGRSGASAGIGVFFGTNDPRNVSCKIEGKQTNNTAELSAILRAYSILQEDILLDKKIMIVSDSEYTIRCATSYGEKCAKKEWTADIPNKEMVRQLYDLHMQYYANVRVMYVRAHTENEDIHSVGNFHADRLANESIGYSTKP